MPTPTSARVMFTVGPRVTSRRAILGAPANTSPSRLMVVTGTNSGLGESEVTVAEKFARLAATAPAPCCRPTGKLSSATPRAGAVLALAVSATEMQTRGIIVSASGEAPRRCTSSQPRAASSPDTAPQPASPSSWLASGFMCAPSLDSRRASPPASRKYCQFQYASVRLKMTSRLPCRNSAGTGRSTASVSPKPQGWPARWRLRK